MNQLKQINWFHEVRDMVLIALGLSFYALGWELFLIPYEITTGGVTGIAAIVFYASGFPMQYTYFCINAVLLACSMKILGWRFSIRTLVAIFILTGLLSLFHQMIGEQKILGEGQDFMACILGATLCGLGLGIAFINNGSTGGTDIIAAVVNKYRDISFGRMIMYCDIVIITSCYFVFHDWKRVVFGYVTMVIISYVLDMVVSNARQSVQFMIFSKEYAAIADHIIRETHRGVTVLDGTGWYSKNEVKVLVVMAKKSQSVQIFRLVKEIDPNAFISQSSVNGVYGEGFDRIKVK